MAALPSRRARPRRQGPPAPRIKPGRQEDPAHLALVRALPCVICGTTPGEAHHIRDGQVGAGQKAGDNEAISLCPAHHRTGPDSIHALGTREWQRRFGTQRHHLTRVMRWLDAQAIP
jgi:hypothetical protein